MRDGKALTYTFKDGLPADIIKEKTKGRGTAVTFKLDNKHINVKAVTTDMVESRLKEKAYLYPEMNIWFVVVKDDKEVKKLHFIGKDIIDRVKKFKPDTDIIRVTDDRDVKILDKFDDRKPKNKNVVIDLAFALSEKALDTDITDNIIAYGNNIKNYIGGAHVEGLREGVVKYFRLHVLEKINGKKNENTQIIPTDIMAGICGFVTVKIHNPEFRGQYKDQLSNQEVKFAVRDAVCEALEKEKPATIKKMIDFVKSVANGRIASKKVRKKDVSNAYSKDKIAKYFPIIKSIHTKDPELIIVEGDSAADGTMSGVDKYNQAIYTTVRPSNLIDAELSTVVKAKTAFNDIIDICGIELGKNCDVSKSFIKKILIMSDADCDGEIIAVSILGLIAKHCPDLIKAGMVGRIIPPAYSFRENNKTVYVASQEEFFKRLMKRFSKDYSLKKAGRVMTEDDLYRFLKANFRYKDKLDKLSDRYNVNPKFMEHLAVVYTEDKKVDTVAYWQKVLKDYRDLIVRMEDKIVVIDGSVGNEYIHIALDAYFHEHMKRFRIHLRKNLIVMDYQINGDDGYSVYDVMARFEKYRPKDIERYKGLGDLDPKELERLCLNRKNRIVKYFKFGDLKNDLEKIHIILSGKSSYLAVRSDIMMNRVADEMEIDT